MYQQRTQLLQCPHGESRHSEKALKAEEEGCQVSRGSDEVTENQSLQCLKLGPHSKISGKPWWRLRRSRDVIPLCALWSSHWEMYRQVVGSSS